MPTANADVWEPGSTFALDPTKLPLAGGHMTGHATAADGVEFDDRDLSVDGAKLDLIEDEATQDQIASEVVFSPAGTIEANEVQAAIEELDTDIVALDLVCSNIFDADDRIKLDGITAGADITGDNTAADTLAVNGVLAGDITRCRVPTSLGMSSSGASNIEILMNKTITGNDAIIDRVGFVLLMEGNFVGPNGDVRSISEAPKALQTNYRNFHTAENGIAYVIWGAEAGNSRWPPGGNGYGPPGDDGLFIVEWRESSSTFVVVSGSTGPDLEWDQQPDDYLFFIIQTIDEATGITDVCLDPTWLAEPRDTAGGSWDAIPVSKVWWSNTTGTFPSGNPTQDLVTTFYDFDGASVGTRTLRGTLTTAGGTIAVTSVGDSGIVTSYVLTNDGTNAVLATITATLATGKIMKAQVSWTAMNISSFGNAP